MIDLTIDPQLEAYVPDLQDGEQDALKASLKSEGCRDPIVVWRGIVVDGHHRYRYCRELGIEAPIVDYSDRFASIREVKAWMFSNTIARRNLTTDQLAAWAARDGFEPPVHVRVKAVWMAAQRLAASAPADILDKVIRTQGYTVAQAINDAKRRIEGTRKRAAAAATHKPKKVEEGKLRTDRGTLTRQGVSLQRSIRDVLAPVVEAYLAHGHSPEDVLAVISKAAEDLCRATK